MYESQQNSNIFIVDSAHQIHKTRGANEQAFIFLYNEDLFKIDESFLNIEKENQSINNFKHFNETALLNHATTDPHPHGIITPGERLDGGSLFIHKPMNAIFYCQKPSDFFFTFSPDYLNYLLEQKKTTTKKTTTKKTTPYSLIFEPSRFYDFLFHYVDHIWIDPIKLNDSNPTYWHIESNDDIKYYLKELESSDNYGFKNNHYKIHLDIDWETLGYDFKTYSGQNAQEFKQMAMDLIDSGIELSEREQTIWCKQLVSLLKITDKLKTSEKTVRQDFYSEIQSIQENRIIKQQVNQSNKNQNNNSGNSEQSRTSSKTKIL